MLAFMGPGHVREVQVPEEIIQSGSTDQINTAVFNLGQNDKSPSRQHLSVSPGDVIEWVLGDEAPSRYYVVELIGFSELTKEQFDRVNCEDHPAGELPLGRFHLVRGMDPLAGMPSEMKISTVLVLQHVLSRDHTLIEDGVITEKMHTDIKKFVDGVLKDLRVPKDS